MKYRQLGQGWIDATIINLALAGLLVVIVVLRIVVPSYQLYRRLHHVSRHLPDLPNGSRHHRTP